MKKNISHQLNAQIENAFSVSFLWKILKFTNMLILIKGSEKIHVHWCCFRTEWTVFVTVTMVTGLSVGVRMEQPGYGDTKDRNGGLWYFT